MASNLEKFKKNNLTASNPIIGATLATQIVRKSEKILPSVQMKIIKETSLKPAFSISQMSKPALANTKIPKYIKKTLKFAKGV